MSIDRFEIEEKEFQRRNDRSIIKYRATLISTSGKKKALNWHLTKADAEEEAQTRISNN